MDHHRTNSGDLNATFIAEVQRNVNFYVLLNVFFREIDILKGGKDFNKQEKPITPLQFSSNLLKQLSEISLHENSYGKKIQASL